MINSMIIENQFVIDKILEDIYHQRDSQIKKIQPS